MTLSVGDVSADGAYGPPGYTKEELAQAQAFAATFTQAERDNALRGGELVLEEADRKNIGDKVLADCLVEYRDFDGRFVSVSSDVGDVSWHIPTGQCVTAVAAFGTSAHTWQMVAQGKLSYYHKGMLYAARTMAATAVRLLRQPNLLAAAKQELADKMKGEPYLCPLPEDAEPPA